MQLYLPLKMPVMPHSTLRCGLAEVRVSYVDTTDRIPSIVQNR